VDHGEHQDLSFLQESSRKIRRMYECFARVGNYMNCKPPGGCNKNFCYVCSQPWEPTHSDHFKCSQYKPDKEEEMQKNKEKSFLE
jgi:hypothetical protein